MLAPSLGRCAVSTTIPFTARGVLSSRGARSVLPRVSQSPSRRAFSVTTSVGGETEDHKNNLRPIKRATELGRTSRMERVRVWAGMPSDDAVERLSVICAHCNAKLTPGQMDYDCDTTKLHPTLREKFKPLTRDAATNAFLLRSSKRPYLLNLGQAYACTVLRKWVSLTDANAMLGRGKMFVLSVDHVRDLLAMDDGGPEKPKNLPQKTKKLLLDVGAGEGEVTETFRKGGEFDVVVATEASAPMVKRLRQKKIDVVIESTDVTTVTDATIAAGVVCAEEFRGFDCVCLLNVLDRCDTPFMLLNELRALLNDDGGVLVLAVVVPFRPFVEDGQNHRVPKQKLGLDPNGNWETGVNAIWETVLKPCGFALERVARVPYISEGDQKHGAYILDDAVFVLSKAKETTSG